MRPLQLILKLLKERLNLSHARQEHENGAIEQRAAGRPRRFSCFIRSLRLWHDQLGRAYRQHNQRRRQLVVDDGHVHGRQGFPCFRRKVGVALLKLLP